MNVTVLEQDIGFATVSWTAPNDPNKDKYSYLVTWSQNEYSVNSRIIKNTEFTIPNLSPGWNYTATIDTVYNNRHSIPVTINVTTGIVFMLDNL